MKYINILKSEPKRTTAAALAVCLFFVSIFVNFTVVRADAVTLSSDAITLYVGNSNSTTVLTAEISPANVSDKEVEWESSNPDVAAVKNGVVTAVTQGEAVISAISGDGEAQAQCSVVVGKGVTDVYFEQEEITLYAYGAPLMLTPIITPADATNKSLVWTSSDYDVVSVDLMGGITPRSAGDAVISASSVEGKVTASCAVHVVDGSGGYELTEEAIDISAQRAMKKGSFTNYLPISRTLNVMLDIQCGFYNVIYKDSATVASCAEVAQYVNPENYSSGAAKYQFLDLSVPNNMTAADLDKFLKGKGILSGMGQVFIDAANEYGVSEAYLAAHACLETGNGTSRLARGVSQDGTVVYNMFGIGAYDGNALRGGAAYARSQGWTTPEAAVKGGAAWIAKNYIYRSPARQNTLYKMRWNPLSPGTHQYATDVGWAVKQAYTIEKIIGGSDCLQIFEIPAYSGAYNGYIPDVTPVGAPQIAADSAEAEMQEEAEEEEEEEPEEVENRTGIIGEKVDPSAAFAEAETDEAAGEAEFETAESEAAEPDEPAKSDEAAALGGEDNEDDNKDEEAAAE